MIRFILFTFVGTMLGLFGGVFGTRAIGGSDVEILINTAYTFPLGIVIGVFSGIYYDWLRGAKHRLRHVRQATVTLAKCRWCRGTGLALSFFPFIACPVCQGYGHVAVIDKPTKMWLV